MLPKNRDMNTKLTALMGAAVLCFAMVADAKTVEIPAQIFGFTFGASKDTQRSQCKALKGIWDYQWDMCENPLLELGPECYNLRVSVGFDTAKAENGARHDRLWFRYLGPEDSGSSFHYCHNKWLEWAHDSFGEPSKKDKNDFWWFNQGFTESVNINNGWWGSNSMWVWFSKTTPGTK